MEKLPKNRQELNKAITKGGGLTIGIEIFNFYLLLFYCGTVVLGMKPVPSY